MTKDLGKAAQVGGGQTQDGFPYPWSGCPAANTLNRDSLLHHQTELSLHSTRPCSSICCKSPFKKLHRLLGFLKYQHPFRAQALQCQHQASVPRRNHFDTRNLSSHQGSSAGANKMCSREICKKMEIFRLNRTLIEKRRTSCFSVLCFLCPPPLRCILFCSDKLGK